MRQGKTVTLSWENNQDILIIYGDGRIEENTYSGTNTIILDNVYCISSSTYLKSCKLFKCVSNFDKDIFYDKNGNQYESIGTDYYPIADGAYIQFEAEA